MDYYIKIIDEFAIQSLKQVNKMTNAEFDKIRKELLLKMKFLDTTIKGVSESQEYKEVSAYNHAIRDVIDILKDNISG